MPYSSDVAIQAMTFHPDGGFDITYAEQADIHPKGVTIKQHSTPGGVVSTDDVVEAIRILLDLAIAEALDAPSQIVRHN